MRTRALFTMTAAALADQWETEEAAQGIAAFFGRQPAPWAGESGVIDARRLAVYGLSISHQKLYYFHSFLINFIFQYLNPMLTCEHPIGHPLNTP
jgi:hypothetical protein